MFAGLRTQSVETLLAVQAPSSAVMTAYRVPEGYDYAGLHDFLKAAGFIIYAGQGRFNGEVFRIAVMGDLDAIDIDRLLTACRRFWERGASVL